MSEMVRILCRWSSEDDELYYSGGFQSGTHKPGDDTVIGICKTPKGERPDSSEDWKTFKENVEEVATSVRWFDKGGL